MSRKVDPLEPLSSEEVAFVAHNVLTGSLQIEAWEHPLGFIHVRLSGTLPRGARMRLHIWTARQEPDDSWPRRAATQPCVRFRQPRSSWRRPRAPLLDLPGPSRITAFFRSPERRWWLRAPDSNGALRRRRGRQRSYCRPVLRDACRRLSRRRRFGSSDGDAAVGISSPRGPLAPINPGWAQRGWPHAAADEAREHVARLVEHAGESIRGSSM
jgi:hypothetical protein